MKIKKRKKLWILIPVISVPVLAVSIPLIVHRYSPFYLVKIDSFEKKDLKQQLSIVDKEQRKLIIEKLNSKKIEKENEILFVGDYPNIGYDFLESYVKTAKNIDYYSPDFERFRASFLELSLSDYFYDRLYILDVYKFINIFSFYQIEPNWQKIDVVLSANYNSETGLFISPGDTHISSHLFKSLFENSKTLFHKYYNPEKIKKFFKNFNFAFADSERFEISLSDDYSLMLIASYLDESERNKLFDSKNIKSWIQGLDEKFFASKIVNDRANFGRRFSFVSTLKPIVKSYYSNFLVEKDIEKEIEYFLNLKSYLRKDYLLSWHNPNLFKNNKNLFETAKEVFKNFLTNQKITGTISLKNLALSYILFSGLDEQLNQTKIHNHVVDRIKVFETSLTTQEFIRSESEQLYYLSFLLANYFKNNLNDLIRLVNVLNKKIETSTSISYIWTIIKSLMLFQEKEATLKVGSSSYRTIYNSLKRLSSVDHKLYFEEMLTWIEIDKAFDFKVFSDDFYKKLVENLKNNDIGFKKVSSTSDYSLKTSLLIFNITKKYFSDNKELLELVIQSNKKLLEKVKSDNFQSLITIEDIYSYFSLEQLLSGN